jgi:ABC-2 type transport system permease protein
MKSLRYILKKEFTQIRRDPILLRIIFAVPILQLLIIPLAADYEIKNINIAVVDLDHSTYSRRLIGKIEGSAYFQLVGYPPSMEEADLLIQTDEADLVLELPANFETDLIRENGAKVFMALNAINGMKANLGGQYLMRMLTDYNQQIRVEWLGEQIMDQGGIDFTFSNWYNPYMNYHVYMVPGILAILLTLVGGFLSALNIVKEKEIGTIEQINVSPIRKHEFILGKLIPFFILGMVVFTIGLLISWLVYGIIPVGNLGLLYAVVALYLLAVLGAGLVISNYSETQQQAMLIAFFFLMIFILLGGLFTSIDSMPAWVQTITLGNPLRYLIQVMRMVILKGSGWTDILPHITAVAIIAVITNTWAIVGYRKAS